MDFSNMTLAELDSLFSEKHAQYLALKAKQNPTFADVEAAETLAGELRDIRGAQAKFASMPDLDATFAPKKAEEPKGEDKPEEAQPEGADKVIADADEVNDNTAVGGSGTVTHEETVTEQEQRLEPGQIAGGENDEGVDLPTNPDARSRSAVETLAAQGGRPDVPAYRRRGGARIIATPDLEQIGVSTGQSMDMLKTAEAVLSRAEGFPQFNEQSAVALNESGVKQQLVKSSTAAFSFDIPDELTIVQDRMGQDQIEEILDRACDEKSLPGGSLVAAGGWCAPSEQTYDLTTTATTEGMLSLPEVGVRRGGLKWPIAPNFSAFYANPGFVQTETQAIAGTTKPCVSVDCPSFDEKRMSVEGLCIKVPILTNIGFPEYVKFFVDNTLIAHQHWMNAQFVTELLAIATAAKPITGLGSTVTDALNAMELEAERTRQTYKLPFGSSVEVVLPHWVLLAMRADLSNRSAFTMPTGIADAQILALFRERKLNPQFIYDWQELPLADVGGTAGVNEAVVYPSTYDVLMYPAGTVFKGTQPVINLSTVYDAASLAVNTYTGLFTEQGYLIGKRRFHISRLTLPVCNSGRTGASNFTTCGVGA